MVEAPRLAMPIKVTQSPRERVGGSEVVSRERTERNKIAVE